MEPNQSKSESSPTELSVVSELLSGSYDVRRALGKSRSYLRYETETEGKRATVLLLPIDCDGKPEDAARVDASLRVLRTLEHPGTAAVRRHGVRHGIPFVEHPPFHGRTLAEQLEQGPVGRERALSIALEILEALQYAESRGLSHGALTPDDVVLIRDSYDEERAVVFGIGLASVVRELDGQKTGLTERDPYAAPELLEGAPPSGRADVYSVGALLYRMITDEVPPPPPIVSRFAGNPLLPPDLEPLLIRALAPELVDRYPSVDEMRIEVLDALNARRALSSRPPRRERRKSLRVVKPGSKRWAFVFAAAALVVAGSVGVLFAFNESGDDVAVPEIVAEAPLPAPEPVAPPAAPVLPPISIPTASPAAEAPVAVEAARQDLERAPVTLETDLDPLDRDVVVDPLRGDLPEALSLVATRLLDGEEPTRAELVPLYRHATRNPEDPRANLLLGDTFVELGWYSDAIERYYSAHSTDPASRRHGVMLENLVWLTFKDRHVADFAADAIADIYGAEAETAVAAAIASDPEGPGQRERLERLYTRITR
jgi:serine/threonine protein kinase